MTGRPRAIHSSSTPSGSKSVPSSCWSRGKTSLTSSIVGVSDHLLMRRNDFEQINFSISTKKLKPPASIEKPEETPEKKPKTEVKPINKSADDARMCIICNNKILLGGGVPALQTHGGLY
ncbi:Protein of unknown function [Cotesia congregata]|uniref:Uncharacterized protein n=1 Tax=Cotesia congregata TaxID=51543 RepID=A0A8J2MPS4_COTCN|nr:Protein of unknown function [Cotesia congregata]